MSNIIAAPIKETQQAVDLFLKKIAAADSMEYGEAADMEKALIAFSETMEKSHALQKVPSEERIKLTKGIAQVAVYGVISGIFEILSEKLRYVRQQAYRAIDKIVEIYPEMAGVAFKAASTALTETESQARLHLHPGNGGDVFAAAIMLLHQKALANVFARDSSVPTVLAKIINDEPYTDAFSYRAEMAARLLARHTLLSRKHLES